MDKGYEKERFESLSIKGSVAKKFRRFSKAMSESQSMTLLLMIEFFANHGISPNESLGPKMQTLENLIKKRINGVISIIKDIEKNQTKPTNAMLFSLFEEKAKEEVPMLVEKKFMDPILITEDEELTYYRDHYYKMKKELNGFKFEVRKFMNKISLEKRTLGKDYFKLNTTKKDFEKFKNENNI
ncbi:BfmA/BtgA family mobilization protein [Aureibaculum luteum]|uniref:BfmA/BtgA family mobilization protein n=1 Tax=Aureibaculum luteum TaxID=1548456 RepID=UPI0018E54D0D|nr:BfmA/BtgA family mobilization protein [Aureibaculum luteum]